MLLPDLIPPPHNNNNGGNQREIDMADTTMDLKSGRDDLRARLKDPDYTPPLAQAVPLGIQHVLAMFVSNVTPAIIVAGAAGFGFGSGSPDFPQLIYLIQMAMLFAGIATLFQTIGFGPVGGRLPIVQGTSFAFLPVMIPIVAGQGVAALPVLMGGIVIGGIFHFFLGTFIGKLRFALPPLVTGLIVLMIGLALIKVGIQYAAGGVPQIGTEQDGSLANWSVALVVIVVTLLLKFFTRGMWSIAAVLLGLIAGYLVALAMGMVSFANVGNAGWLTVPVPFKWGFQFSAGRLACASWRSSRHEGPSARRVPRAVRARQRSPSPAPHAAARTAVAGVFGASNTSGSQNVGLSR